jgi:hypothetical protein
MHSTLATTQPTARGMMRICSGGCEHFNPVYVEGRKRAGIGTCDKHHSDDDVRVGIRCLWPNPRVEVARTSVA